jgi:hypothetical protein
MNFKEIFKAPFSTDDYGLYVFDKDSNICLDYSNKIDYNPNITKQLCALLNGESVTFEYKLKAYVKNATDCFIMFENGDVITIRGWGYLTGVKRLSNKDATAVQDSFFDYIINKIKENQNENKNK